MTSTVHQVGSTNATGVLLDFSIPFDGRRRRSECRGRCLWKELCVLWMGQAPPPFGGSGLPVSCRASRLLDVSMFAIVQAHYGCNFSVTYIRQSKRFVTRGKFTPQSVRLYSRPDKRYIVDRPLAKIPMIDGVSGGAKLTCYILKS